MAASRPSSSGSQKRNYLSLERKVEVIKHLQNNPGTSIRALGEIFGCGKCHILKNKESLLFTRLILLAVESIQVNLVHQSMLKSMMRSINGLPLLALKMFILEGHN